MTLRDFFRIMWLQKGVIVGAVLLVMLGAIIYHIRIVPVYYSVATVAVDPTLGNGDSTSGLKGMTVSQSSVGGPAVTQAASDALGLSVAEVQAAASASESTPGKVDISAAAATPLEAQRVATAYAKATSDALSADVDAYLSKLQADLAEVTQQLANLQVSGTTSSLAQVQASILSERYRSLSAQTQVATAVTTPIAVTPASPGGVATPPLSITMEIALLVGLMAGVGLALLRQWLDGRVVDAIDIRAVDIPAIGTLTRDKGAARSGRPAVAGTDFVNPDLMEDLRRLRTACSGLYPASGAVLVVTGVEHGDGATFTAANLAAASARSGLSTIVVSGDVRNPDISEFFGVVTADGQVRRPDEPPPTTRRESRHNRGDSQNGSADGTASLAASGSVEETRVSQQENDGGESLPGVASPAGSDGKPNNNGGIGATTQTSSARGRLRPRSSRSQASATLARVARVARPEQAVWIPAGPYGTRAGAGIRLVPTGVEGLSLLPSLVGNGEGPDGLASGRVRDLVDRLRVEADLVVMDSPAVLEFADAAILAGYADALLLVVRARRTRTRDLARALGVLRESNVTTAGAVVNRVKRRVHGRASRQTGRNRRRA